MWQQWEGRPVHDSCLPIVRNTLITFQAPPSSSGILPCAVQWNAWSKALTPPGYLGDERTGGNKSAALVFQGCCPSQQKEVFFWGGWGVGRARISREANMSWFELSFDFQGTWLSKDFPYILGSIEKGRKNLTLLHFIFTGLTERWEVREWGKNRMLLTKKSSNTYILRPLISQNLENGRHLVIGEQ